MVEQLPFKQLVVGSNPTRPTIFRTLMRQRKAPVREITRRGYGRAPEGLDGGKP